jgi:DNA-binding NtrC family response regulator
MPGTPVRALLERWAAVRPGRPVLICSGHVAEELARRGIEEGRYALLSKPFTPAQLVAAVARVIAGARESAGTAHAAAV